MCLSVLEEMILNPFSYEPEKTGKTWWILEGVLWCLFGQPGLQVASLEPFGYKEGFPKSRKMKSITLIPQPLSTASPDSDPLPTSLKNSLDSRLACQLKKFAETLLQSQKSRQLMWVAVARVEPRAAVGEQALDFVVTAI